MATHDESRFETATLGGGCFWCLEAVYNELRGVERVISGYAGGHVPQPLYEEVCSGRTGHAEVVQVVGTPYRSAPSSSRWTGSTLPRATIRITLNAMPINRTARS